MRQEIQFQIKLWNVLQKFVFPHDTKHRMLFTQNMLRETEQAIYKLI